MTYYNEIAKGYEELHGEEQLRKARIILEHIDIKPKDCLLDVGCGTGHYLRLFPAKITGIDPAAKLLEQSEFDVIEGKAESLPFKDASFDIVISLTAVHNFDDIPKGLKEMARVAKRIVAISVLKKSKKFEEIEKSIREIFAVQKEIDDPHDVIFIAQKRLNSVSPKKRL